MSSPTSAALANQMSVLIDRWRKFTTQHRDWLAGTAAGGPNGDGTYPLTDSLGVTVMVACPAAQEARVNATVNSAGSYADVAQAASEAAVAARQASEQARDIANSHVALTQAARDLANTYANTAGSHAADAKVWRDQVVAAAPQVSTDAATAVQAAADAEADRVAAEAAKVAAETAATNAQTFDPASYYNKTTSDSRFAPVAHTHTKAAVGLGSVDNTSDADKPVSTAQAAALAAKANLAGATFTDGISASEYQTASIANHVGYGAVQAINQSTGAAAMCFHRNGLFATYFGLDTDNQFKFGGFSEGAVSYKFWTEKNFNPANKLDARNSLGTVAQMITDWNTATQNGWYMGSGVANAPNAAWYIGLVTVHNALWITQEIWDFTAPHPAPRFIRQMNNGTWSAWSNQIVATAPEFREKTTTEMALFIKDNSATTWNPPAGKVYGQYYNTALFPGAVQFVYDYGGGGYGTLKVEVAKWILSLSNAGNHVEIGGGGVNDTYNLMRVAGGIKAQGVYGMLGFADRTTARDWGWYGSADVAYLWNGTGNAFSFTPTGGLTCGSVISGSFHPSGANGAYIDGNGAGLHFAGLKYLSGGDTNLLWANSSGWVRIPRTFVGGTDPGAAAGTDDLWVT